MAKEKEVATIEEQQPKKQMEFTAQSGVGVADIFISVMQSLHA
jgi:hypothetical protein